MKVLLTAINAKYIHSNLAVYSLKAYADSYFCTPEIEIAEYTINQQTDQILMDIYKKKPDILCFSCYIWNMEYMEDILPEIAKVLPRTAIWLGGPEVSYDARETLRKFPQIKGVMKGEGEETFLDIMNYYGGNDTRLEEIEGITYYNDEKEIVENPWRPVMDLSKIPFVYQDMTNFEHKIIYYESSRGCPFSCSYCLSSVDKKLRFRNLELVKKELQFFIDHKVPQVKFVDRTFNCSHEHAMTIWSYLIEHDNGVTNFHFEISADLLTEEEIALIQSMRPGLIQLEIGVQSTNPDTIREIRRTMQFDRLAEVVKAIKKNGNVHQHLDLIAGLPFEDMDSFARSFDQVYSLKPEQLQLGFLKVLKGSFMEECTLEYGLGYKDKPPYEVLYTKWLTYQDVLHLKGIEEMVEVYYNSGQFTKTFEELEKQHESPFSLYADLAAYYDKQNLQSYSHARATRYEILLEFIETKYPDKGELYRQLLIYDYYLRENAKNRPTFAGEYMVSKEKIKAFYEEEERTRTYLPDYQSYDRNQLRKMTHIEWFPDLKEWVLFDYQNRNPLTKEARTVNLKEAME